MVSLYYFDQTRRQTQSDICGMDGWHKTRSITEKQSKHDWFVFEMS